MGIRKEGVTKDSAIKRDLQDFKEEIIHQFHIISEGLIDQIKLLAEGHSGIIQKLDRVDTRLEGVETKLERVETRLDAVETRLDGVETRLDKVETKLDGVETRLDRVETSFDHLEKENERQHLETRALVKLSFSELDRRLSNLESQVREIQEWKKQVEARLPT
jgi:chromosome segregation ATPase